MWLHRWYHQKSFDFFDDGVVFQNNGLLGRDAVYLTERGKCVFAYTSEGGFKLGSLGDGEKSLEVSKEPGNVDKNVVRGSNS